MLTTWTGAVAVLKFFLFFTPLLSVYLRCDLPYSHPGQIGTSTLASSLGVIPSLASSFIIWKLRCPSFSWIVDSLTCLR